MAVDRKLYRARNSLLGGVCTGVAEYFNIDSIIVQILTVVLTIATGGLLAIAYIALWIIVPRQPDPDTPVDVQPQEVHSDFYGQRSQSTGRSVNDAYPTVPYARPQDASCTAAPSTDAPSSPDDQSAGERFAQSQSTPPEPTSSYRAEPHAVPSKHTEEESSFTGGGALWLGFILLSIGMSALLGTFVTGVEWWQFWPLLFVIGGIGQMVVPGKKGKRMERFVTGLMQFAFGASALPFSLKIVSLSSLEPIFTNLWPILIIMCGFFILGEALKAPLVTLLGGLCAVAFCIIALGWFSIPGSTEMLTLTLPTGREYVYVLTPWI